MWTTLSTVASARKGRLRTCVRGACLNGVVSLKTQRQTERRARVLEACAAVRPIGELVLHLHDTQGRALSCAERALSMGVRKFDASAGGIGGCPYAPGASGNFSTESIVDLCARLGYDASIDRVALGDAARFIRGVLAAPADAG